MIIRLTTGHNTSFRKARAYGFVYMVAPVPIAGKSSRFSEWRDEGHTTEFQ